jgi:hypothetical protein
MKQTAVEWLYDKIKHGITKKQFDEFILEAKEMEKQQIIEANEENMMSFTDGEQYYNKTFNKGQK